MHNLILASRSPRRREMMKLLGYPFTSIASGIEEEVMPDESPAEHVIRLSELKALSVGEDFEDAIVIGSDTIVVLDGVIWGKPRSNDEALAMLMKLQGNTHTVFSGFALYNTGTKKIISGYETTEVTMKGFSSSMALKYIETGEPLDKAGAYGIQGYGAVLIKSIKGCFFNVMGLPLARLMETLNVFSDGKYDYFRFTEEKLQ